MINAEKQIDWANQFINQAEKHQPENIPDWFLQLSNSAQRSIANIPVHNRKQENWRYTNIEGLLEKQFHPVAASDLKLTDYSLAIDINPFLLDDLLSWRIVFINGHYIANISQLETLPAGVSVGSLAEVIKTKSKLPAQWLGEIAEQTENLFRTLNASVFNDGVFIHIKANKKLDRAIEVIYINQSHDRANLVQTRNLVIVEEGAQATIVERFIGYNKSLYFHNNLTEISLDKNASLKHYRLQNESPGAYHLSDLSLTQAANSHYYATTLSFGGRWARTDIHTRFKNPGAKCELNGLYTVGNKQHCDFHLNVQHSVPGCVSRERFKGLLYGKGREIGRAHV